MRIPARRHLDEIDGLRAVAVLAVVGFHMAVGVPDAAPPAWVGCGARGVDLFFAISGFCLAYPFLRAYRADGTTTIGYLRFVARRISRIAPPYWVALAAFGALGLTGFGFPTADHATAAAAVRSEFVDDALFLTSASPTFDASFWTLGIEMRWYLLFPLVLGLYTRSRAAFVAVGIACWAMYFWTPFGIADEGTLPCFMLGIVAADLDVTRSVLRRYAFVAGSLVLAAAVALQSHSDGVDHGDPLWQIAAFLVVVASTTGALARVLRFAPLRFFGVASYSIYLVHQPVLQALERIGVAPWSSAFAAVACGVGFYLAVERPLFDPHVRKPIEAVLLRAGDAVRRRFPARPARPVTTSS